MEEDEEYAEQQGDIKEILRGIEKKTMRERILSQGERADGRKVDEVRPITCEIGILPRTHGSALFTRGQTQALAVTTLGTSRDEQRIDSIDSSEEITKSFMLHYNFPPFATGEAKPYRGTNRREQGHGALAEKAIQPLLPAYDDFPYTIRVGLRRSGVQRILLHGLGLRRVPVPHGGGRAHSGSLCRCGHGSHQGG